MILKAYKYRLYPNKEQTTLINKHCGCSRYIYNFGLNKKIELYQVEKKSLTCIDIANLIPDLKKENIWLKEVNSQCLQMSLRNLDNAYKRFFREKKGFPKFKAKHDNKQSFQIPQHATLDFENSKLHIPKFKDGINIILHRKFNGIIKTITISKTSTNKYFASILVEVNDNIPNKPPISENKAIGIDLGIKSFAVCSNGVTFENPKFLKKSLKKLAHLQRNFSRTTKGSNNRNKKHLILAKQHERVTSQRSDFLHKLSYKLTHDNKVDTICLETLRPENMLKNYKLAQAISDCSWSKFVSLLEYKSEWYGKNILRIGTFEPSSKMCSCGVINKELTLKDRVWTCSVCGVTHERDILAANNIKHFSFHNQNIIGVGRPKSKPAECSLEHVETGSH